MATHAIEAKAIFKPGYILNPAADLVWFLSLPFWALALALAATHYLPAMAAVSVGLLITVPHHFATWLRTYGFSDERERWSVQLVVAPVVIFTLTLLGLYFAPLTVLLMGFLWDHQHSLMQQHGFARIYDFKARAGAPHTRNYDLALSWILYLNVFLTTPLWTEIWVRELYQWNIPISAAAVRAIHIACWTTLAVYGVVYLRHLWWCVNNGYPLNPLKYLFLGASYFLWFFASWYSASLLLYAIAHRLMHGRQYDVIVYSYIQRKCANIGLTTGLLAAVARPGNAMLFILLGLGYAVLYQFVAGTGMQEFGFGIVNFAVDYDSIQEFGFGPLNSQQRAEIWGLGLITAAGILHYYYDSFIWKVSDKKVQKGL
jgi:hypothetical protein